MTLRGRTIGALAALILMTTVTSVQADILYEDIYYWVPSGQPANGGEGAVTYRNPADAPLDAAIKIQETVYDYDQGAEYLSLLFNIAAIHGDAIPVQPFDLYVYSITNLNYDPAPAGTGNGVSGFEIILDPSVVHMGIWAPNSANDYWNGAFNANLADWDIDADQDTNFGDGFGIYPMQTFAGFMIAVPQGTIHSTDIPAQVYTYSGEEAGSDLDFGHLLGELSGPGPVIPEPATMVLLGLGMGGLLIQGRRRASQ